MLAASTSLGDIMARTTCMHRWRKEYTTEKKHTHIHTDESHSLSTGMKITPNSN